jgi:hypothetical protein
METMKVFGLSAASVVWTIIYLTILRAILQELVVSALADLLGVSAGIQLLVDIIVLFGPIVYLWLKYH